VVLLAAGCGGSGGSEPARVDPATAIGLNGDEVIVRGFLSHDAGETLPQMCSALAESYPPTCSRPSLPVSNLSKAAEQAFRLTRDPETGSRWSTREVELSGRIDNGALIVK
jgi:hypothetical protein